MTPRRIGGIETMARELSLQLGERGWTSVLCFRGEPVEAVQRFLALPNVKLEVLNLVPRWSLSSQRRLVGVLRKHRASLLHLNFLDLLAPYALVARACGVRQVFFTDHISRPERFGFSRAGLLKRAAYRLAAQVAKVFCVSDFVRRCWTSSQVLPSDRFVTVYNGVDLERCRESLRMRDQFRRRLGISPDAVVTTQISSLIPEKGCETFIEAARRVCAVDDNAMFLLAGDGTQRRQYEALAERLGLAARLRFLGLVGDPVGEGLFAGSDIICQASNWQEAFGLSIAEAMACAKPVVATRVGGIPELVDDAVTGILVERGDSEGLARGILELVRGPARRSQLGDAGRSRCERNFDHRANAARMVQLYGLPSDERRSQSNTFTEATREHSQPC